MVRRRSEAHVVAGHAAPLPRRAPERDPLLLPDVGADEERFPPPPDLRPKFGAIVRRIYESDVDVLAEYDAIEAALRIDNPLAPGALESASNSGEEMARRAWKLYLVARYEYESYVRKTDVLVGAIREAARRRLEREKLTTEVNGKKVKGGRTKQITDADVVAEAVTAYGDEWADICDRRERAKGMLEDVEHLAMMAKQRCFTVTSLLKPGTRRA